MANVLKFPKKPKQSMQRDHGDESQDFLLRCDCGSTAFNVYASGDVECVDCEAEPECPHRGPVRAIFVRDRQEAV